MKQSLEKTALFELFALHNTHACIMTLIKILHCFTCGKQYQIGALPLSKEELTSID